MQSLVLPAPWFSNTHLGQYRSDIDLGYAALHQRPSLSDHKIRLRASHPSLLMSDSPPTVSRTDRVASPQPPRPVSSEVATSNETVHPSITSPRQASRPPGGSNAPHSQRSFPAPDSLLGFQPSSDSLSLSSSVVQTPFGIPHSHSTNPTNTRTLAPRSTRRTKAHVASACVNCKRKHLGCDSARPCRRCVSSGKAATCVDVTHKKRGRPPLKAEETASRSYSGLEGTTTSRESFQGTPVRGHGHSRTSSREIRPITDLQFLQSREYGGTSSVSTDPAVTHGQRWGPFTSPSLIPGGLSQGSFSPPVTVTNSGTVYPPTPHVPRGAVFSPTGGSYEFRPMLAGPDLSPTAVTSPHASPRPFQPPFHSSRIHPGESPRTPIRPVDRPKPSTDIQGPYREPALRLPPILSSDRTYQPSPSYQTHRRSESYPYSTSYYGARSPDTETQSRIRPYESPRSLMGPGSQLRSSPYNSVHPPASLAAVFDRANPVSQAHQLSEQSPVGIAGVVHSPPERRRSEGDGDDNAPPSKRRRMAVDDIVND